MIPWMRIVNASGAWLTFQLQQCILTAFAPIGYPERPISIGWPGQLKPNYLIDRWMRLSYEQISWHNERSGSSDASRIVPSIIIRSYGNNRNIKRYDFPEHFDYNNLQSIVGEAIQESGEHLLFLRLELFDGKKVVWYSSDVGDDALEFSIWSRFRVSREEMNQMPYGNVGAMISRKDLLRREYSDIIAGFIASTHILNIELAEVREILQTIFDEISPINNLEAA